MRVEPLNTEMQTNQLWSAMLSHHIDSTKSMYWSTLQGPEGCILQADKVRPTLMKVQAFHYGVSSLI